MRDAWGFVTAASLAISLVAPAFARPQSDRGGRGGSFGGFGTGRGPYNGGRPPIVYSGGDRGPYGGMSGPGGGGFVVGGGPLPLGFPGSGGSPYVPSGNSLSNSDLAELVAGRNPFGGLPSQPVDPDEDEETIALPDGTEINLPSGIYPYPRGTSVPEGYVPYVPGPAPTTTRPRQRPRPTPYATVDPDEDGTEDNEEFSTTTPRPTRRPTPRPTYKPTSSSVPMNPAMFAVPNLRDAITVFEDEFNAVIGNNPTIEMIAHQGAGRPRTPQQAAIAGVNEEQFAYEGGIWVPDRNEVWFTSNVANKRTTLRAINLGTNTVSVPKLSRAITNPNGGYFFNGKIYVASFGTKSTPRGVWSIEPKNGRVTPIVNKYQGTMLNGPDDISVISTYRNNKTSMFFSDTQYGEMFDLTGEAQLQNAIYRVDLGDQKIKKVIDLDFPNGVAIDPSQTKLFITRTPYTGMHGEIRVYDLDQDWNPVNDRLFALAENGIPDGIKVDNYGRVWSAEADGIIVRNGAGKKIGQFSAPAFKVGATASTSSMANFALAGDTLVVLGLDAIWKVKLGQQVVTRDRYYTDGLYRLANGPNSLP